MNCEPGNLVKPKEQAQSICLDTGKLKRLGVSNQEEEKKKKKKFPARSSSRPPSYAGGMVRDQLSCDLQVGH